MPALRPTLAAAAAALVLSASAPAYPDAAAIRSEINALRRDPPGYAARLKVFRSYFRADGRYVLPGEQVERISREGPGAVDEAIGALAGTPPLPPLGAAPILDAAAGDHGTAQGPTGAVGHVGPNGETPATRVTARGGGAYVAETISYGQTTAEAVVRQLLVDDGVPRRGHRHILLSPEYRFAGAWCGPHRVYGALCVVDFAATVDGRAPTPRR